MLLSFFLSRSVEVYGGDDIGLGALSLNVWTLADKLIGERHDLLSSLLEANDHDLDIETLWEQDYKYASYPTSSLDDVDLVTNVSGNIYMFLVAGLRSVTCTSFRILNSEVDNLIRQPWRHTL